MNEQLGPVQQVILDKAKLYYHTHKGELITIEAMVVYCDMPYNTIRKALDNLSRKQRMRRISPKRGYALLV